MADELLTVVDDLTTVDEKYQGAYREDGGKFFLNGTKVGDLEIADTAKLIGALNKERNLKEAAEKISKGYTKYAEIDLDAAIEALGRVEELTAGDVDMKAELERKLKAQAEQLVTQHGETLSAEQAKSEKLMGKLRTLMIDNEAIRAINEAGGDVENLLPHVRGRIKIIEIDDDFDVQVLTKLGEPAVDGEAKPVSIEALVKGFEKPFPFAFKGAGSSGGGGAGKDEGTATPKGGKLVLTQEDARDPVRYRAARERAAKEGLALVMEES